MIWKWTASSHISCIINLVTLKEALHWTREMRIIIDLKKGKDQWTTLFWKEFWHPQISSTQIVLEQQVPLTMLWVDKLFRSKKTQFCGTHSVMVAVVTLNYVEFLHELEFCAFFVQSSKISWKISAMCRLKGPLSFMKLQNKFWSTISDWVQKKDMAIFKSVACL